MNHDPERPTTGRSHAHPASWVIAISLAIIALNMTFDERDVLPSAVAQSTRSAGARGIFAFTGQITQSSYGLFMVDVDAGTIWCYEYTTTTGGIKRLRLVSARSWIFDRYLEEYNIEGLTPADVQEMVKQQRSRAQDEGRLP